MILLFSQQEDLNQTSATLVCTLEQTLAILNGPQNLRLKKTNALITTCQQQISHKPQLLTFLQSTLLTVAAITSSKKDKIQDLKILNWDIELMTSDLKNRN